MNAQRQQESLNQEVQDMITLLCDKGVWSVNSDTVFAWLSNFSKPGHRRLAHHLLEKIIFRTSEMLVSSYSRFFSTHIRNAFPDDKKTWGDIHEFHEHLQTRHRYLKKYLRVAPVTKQETGQGESSQAVLRAINGKIINQEFNIPPTLDNVSELEDGTILIFVDDFLGSGQQFKGFIKRTKIYPHAKRIRMIYAPSVAMKNGVDAINIEYPDIEVHPVELLSDDSGVFSAPDDNPFGRDPSYSVKEAKNDYESIKMDFKIGLHDWFGRDNAELPLIFEWGTPNQSLGIIYHLSDNWNSLHSRRA